jgi:NADPH:quinone reductase
MHSYDSLNMKENLMKAIVRQAFGGPEQLVIQEVSTPVPTLGQVLVRIRAFGINRAEQYFRLGAWGDVHSISGIECVGEVEADPTGRWAKGQKVIALMGGMGRSIAGSYAEYVCVPAESVVAVKSSLSWADLAAIPESYATAWACLVDNLALTHGQTVVIRGATSPLGQAAINIASQIGAHVVATTRGSERIEFLKSIGANVVVEEASELSLSIGMQVDGVLDIVGTSTLLDSLKMPKRGGRVCLAGFLGGAVPIEQFNPMAHLPSGKHLSFFGSAFVFGTPEYPLSDIPFQAIIDSATNGAYNAKPFHVFKFDEIHAVHKMLDNHSSEGKIVVVVD